MVIFVIPIPKLSKKVVSKKKQFEDLSESQIAHLSILGVLNNLND